MTILEQAEFQRWKENPLTKDFLSLLAKRQASLMEAWGRGVPMAPEQQAQAVVLGQLAEISFDAVRDMAGLEPVEPVA